MASSAMKVECTAKVVTKQRHDEEAKLYRNLARHHAGIAECYKTLQRWAEEERDTVKQLPN